MCEIQGSKEHRTLDTSCPIEFYILNGQTDEHYLQLTASRPAN